METLFASDARFGSVVTSCGISLSSLTHSTVCPALIVIFSGINLCSDLILMTIASDSWGAAGSVASTNAALRKISVAQIQIADLSVENICESSGLKFCRDAPGASKAEPVRYKPEL